MQKQAKTVSVQNTGYLKDIKVTLDGNNYELKNEDETSSKGSFAEIANNSESLATSNDGKNANVASITNEQSENVVNNNNIATTVTSNSIGNNTTATLAAGKATTTTSEAGNAATTDSNTDENALTTNNLDSKNDASQIKSINDNVNNFKC